jgi:hypothetical protein
VADLIGFTSSDMSPSKTEGKNFTFFLIFFTTVHNSNRWYKPMFKIVSGNLRFWESSINLVNVLRNEIRDGQLSFRGKKVLEVCNYPFIFVLLRFLVILYEIRKS